MIKVYFEAPLYLGHAFGNIRNQVMSMAPEEVQEVQTVAEADYQIVPLIGKGSRMEFKKPLDKLILFYFCYFTSTEGEDPNEYWEEELQNSIILSYYDIPSYFKKDMRFIRTPVGVDTEVFRRLPEVQRVNMAMSTGHVEPTEKLREFYDGAIGAGYKVAHVGHNFAFGRDFSHYEDIDVEAMVILYNQSRFCNAMRIDEGYEISNIEGVLCGCRPICLDYPMYRYWFEDWSVFVPDLEDKDEMAFAITEAMLLNEERPVTDNDSKEIARRFDYRPVYKKLWKEILKHV